MSKYETQYLKLEQDAQEIEVLLSNDFENMNLSELQIVKAQLDKVGAHN